MYTAVSAGSKFFPFSTGLRRIQRSMSNSGDMPKPNIPKLNKYQEKAFDEPITGEYVAFAREVRRLMGLTRDSQMPHLSLRQAEVKTGLSLQTLSRMRRGELIGRASVERFAEAFGVDTLQLLHLAGHLPGDRSRPALAPAPGSAYDPFSAIGDEVDLGVFGRIPVAEGFASAGETLSLGGEDSAGTADGLLPGGVRGIRVRGDCMEPLFRDGDLIFVNPTPIARNGDIVVARVNGETVSCKVYHMVDEETYLTSHAEHEPKTIIHADFEILGVVEGYTRLKGRDGWPK